MNIEVIDSIARLDPKMLGNFSDILCSSQFLGFIEEEYKGKLLPHHFILKSGDRLIGFVPCYVQLKPVTYLPELHFSGRVPKLLALAGFDPLNTLVIHSPLRLRSDIKVFSRELSSRFIDFIEKKARMDSRHGVIYASVSAKNPLAQELRKKGYIEAFYDYFYELDVDFRSYEDFLASLRKKERYKLKKDSRNLKEARITIKRLKHISQYADELAALHLLHARKYGSEEPQYIAESFRCFDRHIKDKILFAAFDKGKMIAYALDIYDKGTFHGLIFSQDYELSKDTYAYFSLVFVEAIKKAISLGCKKIDFGLTMHTAKAGRGCAAVPLYTYMKFFNPVYHHAMAFKIRRYNKARLSSAPS